MQFRRCKEAVERLLEELEMIPETSFEQEVVCEDVMALTIENMTALKDYNIQVSTVLFSFQTCH